jgi:hypothetical protein
MLVSVVMFCILRLREYLMICRGPGFFAVAPPPPSKEEKKFAGGEMGRGWRRSQKHTTAIKPGPIQIIQYSLHHLEYLNLYYLRETKSTCSCL